MTTMKTQRRTGGTPVLPRRSTASAAADVLLRLRRFHLSGPAAEARDPLPDLMPALLYQFAEPEKIRTDYPLYLPALAGTEGEPLCLSLGEFLQGIAPDAAARVVVDNLPRLEARLRDAIARIDQPQAARPVFAEAAKTMLGDLKLSLEERERVDGQLRDMAAKVPDGARFLPHTEQAPVHLLAQAARHWVSPMRAALSRDAASVAEKVRGLLETDRRGRVESSDPAALRQSLGKAGEFVDPAALAGVLGPRRGSAALRDERRTRLENVLAVLDGAAGALKGNVLTLVHENALGAIDESAFPGVRVVTDDDPCAAAEWLFDEQAEQLAEVVRALRTARLELENRYDAARHEAWLKEHTWETFSAEEQRLLHPVVAVERGYRLAGRPMQSLSRLLLSGRPVQVVVVTQPACNPGADADAPLSTGFRLEPGYLGLSHREAFVQQSSAARPLHMAEGFRRALRAGRAGLHVLATGLRADGREPKIGAWLYAGAALEGRAHPFFHYDPVAGTSWARRFDIQGNPQIEEAWPHYDLVAQREGAGEETLNLSFSFADFALLEPGLAPHFHLVPEDLPESDLITVSAYLELAAEETAGKIPYVWAVDAASRLRRVAVSRRLVLACRDRQGYWRTLQEFAGVKSDYVSDAVAAARRELDERLAAEKARMAEEMAAEIERVKRTAGEELANRLTAALLDVDLASLPSGGGGLAAFRGKSVDQIAGELMQVLGGADLEAENDGAANARVDSMANELMKLIDPEDL